MALSQGVSGRAGGITSLQRLWPNGRNGTQWADLKNPLGRFVYSSYTQEDYNELFDTYMFIDPTEWWVSRDYGKYNVSEANPKRKDAFPDAQQFWFRKVRSCSSTHIQTSPGPLFPGLDIGPSAFMADEGTWQEQSFSEEFPAGLPDIMQSWFWHTGRAGTPSYPCDSLSCIRTVFERGQHHVTASQVSKRSHAGPGRAHARSACSLQDAEGSFHVVVVANSEQEQVEYYGAPAQVWYSFTSPGEDDRLLMEILWVNKTATRLPEVRC